MNFELFQETIVNHFNHYHQLVQTAIEQNVDNFNERDQYIKTVIIPLLMQFKNDLSRLNWNQFDTYTLSSFIVDIHVENDCVAFQIITNEILSNLTVSDENTEQLNRNNFYFGIPLIYKCMHRRRTNDNITRNLIIRHNCNIYSDTPGHEYNICYYIIHKWISQQQIEHNNKKDVYDIDNGRACNVLTVVHEKGYDLNVELNRPFNGSNCMTLLRSYPNIKNTRLGRLLIRYGVTI
jgi:hypothetical protein